MSFASVIQEQGVPFIAHLQSKGDYVDGEWIKGQEVPEEMTGIILPLSDDDLKYAENGTYSAKERKLLVVKPLAEGTRIEYKDALYTVQAFKDYSAYTDVNIYLMRWRKK